MLLLVHFTSHPVPRYGALIEVSLALLQIVFNGQVLRMVSMETRQVQLFAQIVGITTGLSCAVQLANAFLLGMDRSFQHTFQVSLLLYKRFVDDVLVITRPKVHTPDMLQSLNSFDPLINCTQDGLEADDRVSFLDLDIDYSGGKLV